MAHAAAASPEVMRVLAHELRQPLSTIQSIAYYLTLILPEDEKVREQLEKIQQLVEQSNWMLTSSQFLTDPMPAPCGCVDLRELLEQIELTDFETQIAASIPGVHADAALLRAMLENLAALFRQFPSRTVVHLARESAGVSIEFANPAPGYRGESSLGPGSSLSIEGARRVAESFGGSMEVRIDAEAGVRLRVMLP